MSCFAVWSLYTGAISEGLIFEGAYFVTLPSTRRTRTLDRELGS